MITVIVCITCGQQAESVEGRRPGEHFADRVEEVLQARRTSSAKGPAIQLQRTQCLMSCQRSCSAALHEEGKYSYVFGEFSPDSKSAEALLDFAAGYHVSDTGQVPFNQWPQGIKGHFVARIPPIELATVIQKNTGN